VTPKKKTVKFTTSEPTKVYSRNTSTIRPTQNFDPITGQRLNNTAVYDVTTSARINENSTSRLRQDSANARQLQLQKRSPAPAYQYTEQDITPQNYNRNYIRDFSSQRDNYQNGSRLNDTKQYNQGGYNRSSSTLREGSPQYTSRYPTNNRQDDRQGYNNRGSYRGDRSESN